jgi:CBS domain-containing protein
MPRGKDLLKLPAGGLRKARPKSRAAERTPRTPACSCSRAGSYGRKIAQPCRGKRAAEPGLVAGGSTFEQCGSTRRQALKTVAQILKLKPARIISIGPDVPVHDALKLLAQEDIGAVLVMDGPRLVGILSERDYARKVALKGKSAIDTPVSEIMTREVFFVTPAQTNEECMALMTKKRARHLPVMDDGQVLGVLSIGDLVKDAISEQQFLIDQLVRYIHR